MRLFRPSMTACLLLLGTGLSACLTGGGSSAVAPGTPSGILASPPGETPAGSTLAAAGGSDTMPPRPDMGDKMPAVSPLIADWRITYFSSPSTKVVGSRYSEEPTPLSCEGKTELSGGFFVELGEADQGCEDASCWRWSVAPENRFVRLKLTRGMADKAKDYYQDFRIGPVQPDGSNLQISGTPVENDDLLYFAYTGSEAEPLGFSATLTELTDGAQKFGGTVYLGYFKIKTAASSLDYLWVK
ncbi:MAG TPA: hypothetical protein VFX30_02540 [bacterium]|nr:hypothetical protein [bacterium]